MSNRRANQCLAPGVCRVMLSEATLVPDTPGTQAVPVRSVAWRNDFQGMHGSCYGIMVPVRMQPLSVVSSHTYLGQGDSQPDLGIMPTNSLGPAATRKSKVQNVRQS